MTTESTEKKPRINANEEEKYTGMEVWKYTRTCELKNTRTQELKNAADGENGPFMSSSETGAGEAEFVTMKDRKKRSIQVWRYGSIQGLKDMRT